MNEPHKIADLHECEGVTWNSREHVFEPTTDFDFDAIDRGNPLASELCEADKDATVADAFIRIMQWVWAGGFNTKRSMRVAMVKFCALSACMNPDLLSNASYKQIGKAFGITKSAVSKAAVNFQDAFGCHFRRSRRQQSRDTFKRVQMGNENRSGK